MAYLEALEKDIQDIKHMLTVLLETSSQAAISSEYDKYPPVLTLKLVSEIMGISEKLASDCIHRKDFPKTKVGRRFIIPKDAFLNWLDQQARP